MNTICTNNNIWWSLVLLGLQLKCLAPYHWSLHSTLKTINNLQCRYRRCPHYSTCQSRRVGLLVAHLVVVKTNRNRSPRTITTDMTNPSVLVIDYTSRSTHSKVRFPTLSTTTLARLASSSWIKSLGLIR